MIGILRRKQRLNKYINTVLYVLGMVLVFGKMGLINSENIPESMIGVFFLGLAYLSILTLIEKRRKGKDDRDKRYHKKI